VFLNATAANFGGSDVVAYDSFIGSPGDSCTAGATANSVTCSLASLPPGGSTSFFIVFRGPQTGTRIDLTWTGGGFEGNGGGNGCCSQGGTVSTSLVDPTTDTSFRRQAKSFVNPTGGTLFTGDQAIPVGSADGWTTLVRIPGFVSLPWTTATINEASSADVTPPSPPLACPSYSTSSTCFRSQLAIPGTFASLEITLRLDRQFFNLGRQSASTVPLFYTGDTVPSPYAYVSYPHALRLCSVDAADPALTGFGPVPLPGRPCFSQAPRIIPNNDPTRDLRGDLEFNILARDNGRYEQ
jgi:hypothetical protein